MSSSNRASPTARSAATRGAAVHSADIVDTLVAHFEAVYRDHMRGLPVVNTRLAVEAVGFRDFESHRLGVLVTPWFMNLVLLPSGDAWADRQQGETSSINFPSGAVDFAVCHDDVLGTYLSAVLFRSVLELADSESARALASKIMQDLLRPPRPGRTINRRELLTGLRRR